MESSKFNTSSPLRTNAENASPLRAKLQAALDAYDKENAVGPSGTSPKSQTLKAFNRPSLPGSMNTYTKKSPFHVENRSAAVLDAPLSIRGRLSAGGAIFDQEAGGLGSTFLSKPTEKRSASMAELDEPSPPPKRPRHDDEKIPFVFIKNLKLLHEDNILARRMFLDLVEAQDKRAVYGGHNPEETHTMGPCIDPKDLFDKSDTSFVDTRFSCALDKTTPDYTVILESEGDSIFGTWFQQPLCKEDKKNQRKGSRADGSSQKSEGHNTTEKSDISLEENPADVAEPPAGCETNADKGLPTAPLPLIEAATDIGPLEAILDHSPPPSQRNPNTSPQAISFPPPVAQAPSEVVPEASHLPKAKKTGPEGKNKRERIPKAAQTGSSGVAGSGVAGPSTSTSTGSFAYSDARAQEIWKLANLGDYLGAHVLFEPSEQVILIEGETNVKKHLEKDPKLKKRLQKSPEGTERECLYLCGASAIWKRIGGPEDLAAGEMPQYELTYKRCKDYAYPTVDNYKKHVYRHHLHKYYKLYKKEAGVDEEEKEESVKGKGKAALKGKKAKVSKKEGDDYKGEDHDKDD